MSKEIQKILLFFLISYSIYCAIIVGETWDESFHLNQGKIILDYLFSFGEIDHHILYRENYSAIYWTLSYLLTKQFPLQYQIEVSHLLNLIFIHHIDLFCTKLKISTHALQNSLYHFHK